MKTTWKLVRIEIICYIKLLSTTLELEALGDDFLAEEDDSFLDATLNVPDPPSKVPGAADTVRSKVRSLCAQYKRRNLSPLTTH